MMMVSSHLLDALLSLSRIVAISEIQFWKSCNATFNFPDVTEIEDTAVICMG